jgi:hypothetical protein
MEIKEEDTQHIVRKKQTVLTNLVNYITLDEDEDYKQDL